LSFLPPFENGGHVVTIKEKKKHNKENYEWEHDIPFVRSLSPKETTPSARRIGFYIHKFHLTTEGDEATAEAHEVVGFADVVYRRPQKNKTKITNGASN